MAMARHLSVPWIKDALLSGGAAAAACAQVLDLEPGATDALMCGCRLSDKVHTIGAVLTRVALQRWQQDNPTRDVRFLNGAIVLPVHYEVVINQRTREFALHVNEFNFVGAEGSALIGRPRNVMDTADARSYFDRARADPPAAHSAHTAAASAEPYIQRLARRGCPLACAACPVEAHRPHRLIESLLHIPAEQAVALQRLRHAASGSAEAGSSEESGNACTLAAHPSAPVGGAAPNSPERAKRAGQAAAESSSRPMAPSSAACAQSSAAGSAAGAPESEPEVADGAGGGDEGRAAPMAETQFTGWAGSACDTQWGADTLADSQWGANWLAAAPGDARAHASLLTQPPIPSMSVGASAYPHWQASQPGPFSQAGPHSQAGPLTQLPLRAREETCEGHAGASQDGCAGGERAPGARADETVDDPMALDAVRLADLDVLAAVRHCCAAARQSTGIGKMEVALPA